MDAPALHIHQAFARVPTPVLLHSGLKLLDCQEKGSLVLAPGDAGFLWSIWFCKGAGIA